MVKQIAESFKNRAKAEGVSDDVLQDAAEMASLMPQLGHLIFRLLIEGATFPKNLTIQQFKTLEFMAVHGKPLCMSELASMACKTQSTITETVKKLTLSGYLKRERMPEDDRVVSLSLTAKGQALMKSHFENLQKNFIYVCERLEPEVRKQLIESHKFALKTYQRLNEQHEKEPNGTA